MNKVHVKKGDKVVVLAGKDKGKKSQILSVNPTEHRVVVADVNILVHHNKPKKQGEKGGIVKAPGAIDCSNVQVICPVCGKATRIAHSKNDKKKSIRICKKCGAVLDTKTKVATKKSSEKKTEKKTAPKKENKE